MNYHCFATIVDLDNAEISIRKIVGFDHNKMKVTMIDSITFNQPLNKYLNPLNVFNSSIFVPFTIRHDKINKYTK